MKRIFLVFCMLISASILTSEPDVIREEQKNKTIATANPPESKRASSIKSFCQLLGMCRNSGLPKKNNCHVCALHDSVVICCNLPCCILNAGKLKN